MNLYLRYFDKEILVDNVDEAIAFLAGIEEIGMNPVLEQDIRNYVASDVFYPKRYKTRPRVYFIIIKTEAATMQDFKEKKALQVPGTGKFQYRDTHFVARCKAMSGQDCYNRIVDHLSQRVDSRSQFPSAKGKNFKFQYLGLCK